MGFHNPPMPWRELERTLSGRPRPASEPEAPRSHRRQAYVPRATRPPAGGPPFAELHAHSSFSFLDGASGPEELAEEAVRLGLESLTLTDHDGMYGIVRFAEAAKALKLPTGFGAELSLDSPPARTASERLIGARSGVPDPPATHLLALARDPAGYAALCRVISRAQLRGGVKGRPSYDLDEITDAAGHWLVLTGCRKGAVRQALDAGGRGTFALDPARRALAELVERFGRDNVAVELIHELDPLADERYEALAMLAAEQRLQLVATTAAHYHAPQRRQLATVTAAVRARSTLDELDGWLPAWSGQHLRSGAEMAARFARWPSAVANAARLGREIAFPLKVIAPNLPPFHSPAGESEMQQLRRLTYAGAAVRFAGKKHERRAYEVIEHELAVIDELNFPGYFLVVHDIAQFCQDSGILYQGRGSAACSAVCYALRITAVDAVEHELMFERFLAPERGEPPDIDIDIEAGRREDVIQHVYDKYGREYAAQVANVISYRPKSAIRDVAKALGYSPGQQDAWSKEIERSYYWSEQTERDTENIPPDVVRLSFELQRAPRHLGIHSGGMVMCDRPVIEVCPVEWGRMNGRTVLQWDKDDCAEAGLVKFDLLGLGMLSALHNCFDLVRDWHGASYDLDSIPKQEQCVYDMLAEADSVGVFQVESRAQMATLPRLQPQSLYELAIEVALIRPGPIQGDAVHPYIRRKHGQEKAEAPHPLLEKVLARTLGVPLFQEQLMQIAVEVAGFTPAEADQLRRAMGSKRGVERIDALRERLYEGMAGNGITGELADSLYARIQSFASFGFAESHAISFALLVYASSWLKRHYPAAFCAALLNAQPMGFYSPQSLVQDARRHGIEVRPPVLELSQAGASLEEGQAPSQCPCLDAPQPAVRLGLSSVRTISDELARRIVAERAVAPYTSMADLSRRIGLGAEQVEALATAGAFDGMGASRRETLWAAGAAATARPGQLDLAVFDETAPAGVPAMTGPEQLIADMWATGVTTGTYPTTPLRPRLAALGVITAAALREVPDRTRVTVGGVVTHRQRPSTAGGVTFLNLEDETGMVNVIVPPPVWERNRRVAREAGGLLIRGMLERTRPPNDRGPGVLNVLAERIEKLNLGLHTRSRDFR
jgi:error-prone DNA polymerase